MPTVHLSGRTGNNYQEIAGATPAWEKSASPAARPDRCAATCYEDAGEVVFSVGAQFVTWIENGPGREGHSVAVSGRREETLKGRNGFSRPLIE